MKRIKTHTLLTALAVALIFCACSRLGRLQKSDPAPRADLSLPRNQRLQPKGLSDSVGQQNTKPIVYAKADGDTVYFVPATRDSMTGEQIMSFQIAQVTISASNRRNIVERMGKIALEFVVTVPDSLLASDWRLDLRPHLIKGPDSLPLSDLVFTGERFRSVQQRQYARYGRYLNRIVDSADFFAVFGNIAGFERYLREAEAERLRMLALQRHLDTLGARRAVRDDLAWTFDGEEYGMSVRELRRYNRRLDKLIRTTTRYKSDQADPHDHLNDYLAPRYKYTRGDTLLAGGRIYTRRADAADSLREREAELQRIYDSLLRADAGFAGLSRKQRQALSEEQLKRNTLERMRLTGIASGYEDAVLGFLSDSTKQMRYDIKKHEINGRIRALSSLDTAALMRRYRDEQRIARNERLRAGKDKMFARTVRFPYIDDIRLDTIVRDNGRVSYYYTQEVQADEYSSKLYIWMDGDVTDLYAKRYILPRSDTLTFSVSSMTSFVDTLPRYVQRIVTRDAEVNARYYFTFPKGRTRLDEEVADNRRQLREVKKLTRDLMTDPVFIIDSITLRATSSPEGNWNVNDRLARERAAELKRVLDAHFRILYDSLHIDAGYTVDAAGNMQRMEVEDQMPDLPNLLRTEYLAEDWNTLCEMIQKDSVLTEKEALLEVIDNESNPDRREIVLRRKHPAAYARMREYFYPKMRAVDFRFNLHRRGQQQDTVYTMELDTTYLRGRQLLEKRRYASALEILRPYEDRNTALAYMSLGYDKAALRIFSSLEPNPDVKYLMAILSSRMGDEEAAVQHFLRAVELNPRLKFRGNLDPEISRLVKKYNLFPDDF